MYFRETPVITMTCLLYTGRGVAFEKQKGQHQRRGERRGLVQ